MLGRVLGHYRIVAEIGAGGMGVVYRARDERLDRDVAIKVLAPGTLGDEAARKRFRHEALALSKLNHPNIATIHDFDTQDGVDFVVMEFLDGTTLAQRVHRCLPEGDAARIGRQIASALDEAHERGIVHRDLKPANVIVTPKGQVKLLDFGLSATVSAGDLDLTISVPVTTMAGTLPYMAPEQVQGLPVDARSDIWAAGAVLYEIASGMPPFPEQNPAALIGAILHRSATPPRELNPRLSPALERVILRCLEKDPAKRFQSARELHRAIEDAEHSIDVATNLATPAVTSSGIPVETPPRAPTGRRFALALIALVILAIVAGVTAWKYRRPPPSSADARVIVLVGELTNRTGEPVFDQTLRDLLDTALQDSRVVSVYPRSRTREALARMQRPPDTVLDESIGREICQREGLQAHVSGSIARIGSSYVLIVYAMAPDGTTIASEQRTASEASRVPAELDAIARRIRTGLGESLASVQAHSAPLAQVTSASLDAVRYVTLGTQRLDAGDPVEAVSWFDKAIALDGSFAMAHALLGIAYQNLNKLDLAESELRTASELADRVTHTERLKILGDYHVLIGDFDAGCNDFQALARLQPHDPAPFHGLGVCYARKMAYDQALVENRKALALVPQSIPTRYNIARLQLHKGDLDRARAEADGILDTMPGNAGARRILGRILEITGDTAGAERAFESVIAAGPAGEVVGHTALADLLIATGRMRRARPHLDAAVIAAEKRGDALAGAKQRIALGDFLLQTASAQSALEAVSPIGERAIDPVAVVRLGRLYARSKRSVDAQRLARLMDDVAGRKPNAHLRSLQSVLAAEIALRGDNPQAAVAAAERAVTYESSVLAVDELAQAYDAARRIDDAIDKYGEVLKRAPERADGDDDPSFCRVVEIHYRLGVLLQERARADEAAKHLSSFLSYWSAADENLPLKKDAAARLRRLTQSTSAGTPSPAT